MAQRPTYEELKDKVRELEKENTTLKQTGDAYALHLRFHKDMARVNHVIQQATDVEQMMSEVLQTTLEIFETDRAWLLFPCDPETETWSVPMERTRSEYPGALALGEKIPILPDVALAFRRALDKDEVINIDYRNTDENRETTERFTILAEIFMAVRPQTGKPWLFGMHQCSRHRAWTDEEKNLFREIGHRLGDALTSLLFLRDLRESEKKLYIILNATPDIAFLVEPDGTFILVNDAAAENFGCTKEESVGTNMFALDEYKKLKKSPSILHSILTSKKPYRWEDEHAGRLFDNSVYPIISDEGNVQQLAVFAKDITERKRAEEEKLALERQVRHTQKLESLGVLAGGIAHDFNNLLTTILGNADLALHKLSPMSPACGNIREVMKASRQAAELAKQMLAYSGKGQFVIKSIDSNELLKEMAHLLEVSISKKAALKFNLAGNLPTFNGDVTQIRQIIMNLITNASEAIGDKSGSISLSTGAMYCDGAYLEDISEVLRAGLDEPLPEGVYTYFEVADTGSGMDSATIEKVFDPFFTTKFTGRGLGMSAVLGIVRGHKGALKVYSEVGKGTTFKVLFPVNKEAAGNIAAHGIEEVEWKDWKGSGTILLADDEEAVYSMGKEMLESMGFTVLTASDGREALKVFRRHTDEIVCVLLDLTMPHMDGEEAFRELRRLHPAVTVILCSGYNEQDATLRFAGKGLAGFIQKPFCVTSLRKKLMEVLRVEPL